MQRIVIFASGSGTNAENIIRHFKKSATARVTWVLCNKEGAGVLERAERLGVPSRVFTKKELFSPEFIDFVKAESDFIVLAGIYAAFYSQQKSHVKEQQVVDAQQNVRGSATFMAREIRLAGMERPSASLTEMRSAPRTTWALVKMKPRLPSMITPEPRLVLFS